MEPHRGTLILVFGILSIVVCQILGPFAWAMGNGDLRKMDAGTMDPEGRDHTKAGKICGIIGTVFLILGVIYVIFVLIMAMVFAGTAATMDPSTFETIPAPQ